MAEGSERTGGVYRDDLIVGDVATGCNMKAVPARIHVLLARDRNVGVVIRRGPSKVVCTMLWNRETDEFTMGQWLRGRIYERRCDLSPDGKFMIYFAMNGRWHLPTRGSWTAISQVPYLKAVALYPKGDCWNGGGLFLGNHSYWLNGGTETHDSPMRTGNLRVDAMYTPAPSFGGECPGVYYPRLTRDGWKLTSSTEIDSNTTHVIFEKSLPYGWTLRKIAHATLRREPGKGVYHDAHELRHFESEQCLACPDWEWADYESNRLVWAANGKLFAAELKQTGPVGETELHDFNDMRFEAIKAPY